MFDKNKLNDINPSNEPDKLHELTFALFSYLANMYNSGNLNPSVKNVAHNNEEKAKKIQEVSAPQWFTEMMEEVFPKCESLKDGIHAGFDYYMTLSEIQLMYRSQLPKPKYIPGYETMHKQFLIREKTHKDVMCKMGKSIRFSRVYIKNELFNEIFDEGVN